ncbi:IS66 family insertion sequence element accessory protein TnpB [Sinorhizobium meliloti]|uniref:IS66 family insertion sequence element accessory protein TnpB n=1 Tax=Rhizobium meliloti TaxID=382 RepID=A0AAW9TL09_RHIML|nr:IS66 family insertion sequence element accessory protein TnpB [Sinorhizobium meliloti]MQW32022.1 IS66 family insertion sequence element accessory protein TnpB [Sinorhizobium meliloti]
MFRLGADLKVYLHREPIDFRAGINSLAVLVQETMELDPFAPAVFAFCNRRRDRMKLLFFDRSGFVTVLKRLTEDRFRCQSALNVDPRSASNIDPPIRIADQHLACPALAGFAKGGPSAGDGGIRL